MNRSGCIVLYHFYHPDDVISARLFTELSEFLAQTGRRVEVWPCNRRCHIKNGKNRISPLREEYRGVNIRRVWRPDFRQGSNLGRLANSFFVSIVWLFRLWFQRRADTVIFGTDPQFSYFIIPLVKWFRPKLKIALWAFDLYPEAIYADEVKVPNFLKKMLHAFAKRAYRKCDFIADLGACMHRRIAGYGSTAAEATLVPWALKEQSSVSIPDAAVRKELFGEAELAVLYSGTVGKAHLFEEFIALARELRKRGRNIVFCFAGRGNRYAELRAMVTPEDVNIRFAGFAPEAELEKRLISADLHLLSLRTGWDGIVLPSKFFGSLAAGRPVLYSGTPDSAIRQWVEKNRIGLYIAEGNIGDAADTLEKLADHHEELEEMQHRALNFYRENFSRSVVCKKWAEALDAMENGQTNV